MFRLRSTTVAKDPEPSHAVNVLQVRIPTQQRHSDENQNLIEKKLHPTVNNIGIETLQKEEKL